MKLKIKLGANEPTRTINWWGDHIRKFPNLVRYKGRKYEFAMYDEDPTGEADWLCVFGELRSYDPNWHASIFTDIDDMLDDMLDDTFGRKCECGAVFTSFPQVHMFYCPKWSKV